MCLLLKYCRFPLNKERELESKKPLILNDNKIIVDNDAGDFWRMEIKWFPLWHNIFRCICSPGFAANTYSYICTTILFPMEENEWSNYLIDAFFILFVV